MGIGKGLDYGVYCVYGILDILTVNRYPGLKSFMS